MIRKIVITFLMLTSLITLVLGASSFHIVETAHDMSSGPVRAFYRWETSLDLGVGRSLAFVSETGMLTFTFWNTEVIHDEAEVWTNPSFKISITSRWNFLTILQFVKTEHGGDSHSLTPMIYRGWSFSIEFWVLFVLLVIYPTIAFIRSSLRRYRRRRKGLCVKCGYNLTGNTTGVCSECGLEIKQ